MQCTSSVTYICHPAWVRSRCGLPGFNDFHLPLFSSTSCYLVREGFSLWRPSPPPLLQLHPLPIEEQSQNRKIGRRLQTPPNPCLWEQCLGNIPNFHSCCLGNPKVDYDLPRAFWENHAMGISRLFSFQSKMCLEVVRKIPLLCF